MGGHSDGGGPHGIWRILWRDNEASDVLLGPHFSYLPYSKIRGSGLTPLHMSLPDGRSRLFL